MNDDVRQLSAEKATIFKPFDIAIVDVISISMN